MAEDEDNHEVYDEHDSHPSATRIIAYNAAVGALSGYALGAAYVRSTDRPAAPGISKERVDFLYKDMGRHARQMKLRTTVAGAVICATYPAVKAFSQTVLQKPESLWNDSAAGAALAGTVMLMFGKSRSAAVGMALVGAAVGPLVRQGGGFYGNQMQIPPFRQVKGGEPGALERPRPEPTISMRRIPFNQFPYNDTSLPQPHMQPR